MNVMKIVVSTDSLFSAACLKVEILKAKKGENPDITIDTWTYKKSKNDLDVIFHNMLNNLYILTEKCNSLLKTPIKTLYTSLVISLP